MITLFKMGLEVVLTVAVFCGGIKFGVHFPNVSAKIDSLLSFSKKTA